MILTAFNNEMGEMGGMKVSSEDFSSSSSSSSSSWWSSYSKLLYVLVPLILVSGFIFTFGLEALYWASSYSTQKSNLSTAQVNQKNDANLITKAVDNYYAEKEGVSSSFNLSAPILAKGIVQAAQGPDEKPPKGQPSPQAVSDFNSMTQERRNYSKLDMVEAGLARARAVIRESAKNGTQTADPDYIPSGPMYHNPNTFLRSYLQMEKHFKIYVYEEGELPLFHTGPCKNIYSSEGSFINFLETDRIRTRDPEKAHVYFLPFSITSMVKHIYVANSRDIKPIKHTVMDYVNVIANKYPYWNRSLGADHFMLSCHDWGPLTSQYIPYMYNNSIRVLCNANTSEGFKPYKDVSFPEINMVYGDTKGMIGGPSPSRRTILAFYAGAMHGPVRPILLEHWKDKDSDIQVHGSRLPSNMNYHDLMRKSKFCLCPSGHEVASPRIVEAIYTGCVPVLISDNYVPPFSDVLDWKSFSVEVKVSQIPELKNILSNISQRRYLTLQRRGLQIRKHFEVNFPPKRFDVFYMTLHSIWLRRLNIRIHGDAKTEKLL